MYSSTTLTIHYRADLDMLTVRWLAEFVSDRFQNEYETILTEAQQHKTPRWLMDVRRRSYPPPDMADWTANVWLPRVVTALAPQRPRLAYLISPSREESLRLNATLRASMEAAMAPDRGYDVNTFINEGEATQWLLAK